MFKSGQIVTIIKEGRGNKDKLLYQKNYLTNLQEEYILRIDNKDYLLEYKDGRLVKDEVGNILTVNPDLLKRVYNSQTKELKIGDKITFLDTLLPFKRYGDTMTSIYMTTFKGRECIISHINEDNTFRIKEDDKEYSFSRGMTKEYN